MPDSPFTNPFDPGSNEYNYVQNAIAQHMSAQSGAPAAAPAAPPIPAPAQGNQTPYDTLGAPTLKQNPDGSTTGTYGGPGVTTASTPPTANPYQDLIGILTGMLGGQNQSAPTAQTGSQPYTYAVSQPSSFGFQGPFQGSILDFLRGAGYPDMQIPTALTQGTALGQPDFAQSLNQSGGFNLFSPQQYAGLGPSGQSYLQGMMETTTGIPMLDLLFASLLPFNGLRQGGYGRTRNLSQ